MVLGKNFIYQLNFFFSLRFSKGIENINPNYVNAAMDHVNIKIVYNINDYNGVYTAPN